MKKIILLLLVLSMLVIGGCGQIVPSEEVSQPAEVSQEEALDEVESSLISEDEEIEIGEMI